MEIFNVIAREEDPARCVLGNKLNRVFSYKYLLFLHNFGHIKVQGQGRSTECYDDMTSPHSAPPPALSLPLPPPPTLKTKNHI